MVFGEGDAGHRTSGLRSRHAWAAALAVALLAAAAPSAPAGATTDSPGLGACTTVTAQASLFATVKPPLIGWTENLGFDGHGGMWVSENLLNRVVRFNAGGRPGPSFPLSAPGAVLPGPGGFMYAGYGNSDIAALEHNGQAGVVRFDPLASHPTPTTYVSGLTMVNGAAFDANGDLYTADTLGGTAISRFLPGGVPDPSFRTAGDIQSPNGLYIAGDDLYVTSTLDPKSGLVRIPLDDPTDHVTLAQLTYVGNPFLPKFLDDLTVGPDGAIYVASAVGDLFRVDPVTGAACVVWSGVPITSARFASGFPPFSPGRDLFLTSETGEILHLRLDWHGGRGAQP